MPVSLAGDTGYSEGSLRELLEERNITPDIPIHTKQENSMVAKGDFVYHGDHLICPQGKVLRRDAFQQRTGDLSARGADAGLSVLSHQGNLPPAAAKTTVLHLDDVPPGIPARQGAEPYSCVPA